ncbi:MAG: hypothetical protein WBZ20_18520, partial [Nitrososphaeraceae archaeon]
MESLTEISIGFQSAIIYLPNTLLKHQNASNVESTNIQLPQNIRILGNVILQRYTKRNQFSRRGYEDLDPHENSYEFSPIFRYQINKEQLKGWHEYWKYKKDSIF